MNYTKILILAITTISCADRQFENPVDTDATVSQIQNFSVIQSGEFPNLSWDKNTDVLDHYEILRKTSSGNFETIIIINDLSVLSYTDPSAVTGQDYIYSIIGHSDQNKSSASLLDYRGNFPAPSNINSTPLTDIKIQLTWQDNSSFEEGFRIERQINSAAFELLAEVSANITSFLDSTAILGATISYRVQAFTDLSSSAFTSSASQNTAFPAPSNLSAAAISDSKIQLTWQDNSSFESGFKIERSSAGSAYTELATVTANNAMYIDENLTFGINYSYRVKAFSSANVSNSSNISIASTIFPEPSNLTATAISNTKIQLTWQDNSSFETGFKIERSINSGSFTELTSVLQNISSYIDSNLILGTNYTYKVRAFNTQNSSNYSSEITSVINFPAPTNLKSIAVAADQIDLTWTDNCEFETAYIIERAELGNSYSELTQLTANSTSYSDKSMIDGKIYLYRVKAAVNTIKSESSNEIEESGTVVRDIEGNIYKIVKIGEQWWMAENLRVTKYQNGDQVIKSNDVSEWQNAQSGLYYNWNENSSQLHLTYGRLYNGLAVNDTRNLAPVGWDIPSDEDWKILERALGITDEAVLDQNSGRGTNQGNMLKETGTDFWTHPNSGTNETGFSARGIGQFSFSNGHTDNTSLIRFWSITIHDSDPQSLYSRYLVYNSGQIYRGDFYKLNGASIRCVKD